MLKHPYDNVKRMAHEIEQWFGTPLLISSMNYTLLFYFLVRHLSATWRNSVLKIPLRLLYKNIKHINI